VRQPRLCQNRLTSIMSSRGVLRNCLSSHSNEFNGIDNETDRREALRGLQAAKGSPFSVNPMPQPNPNELETGKPWPQPLKPASSRKCRSSGFCGTVAEKPLFGSAFRRTRCIAPAFSCYEWRDQGRQPESPAWSSWAGAE
jgi:hypothetical protein